jgi:SAM-dependent methyltransferase
MPNDYYQSKASVAEYIEMAKDVSGKELIDKLSAFLPEGSSLLELGSGPGTDWKILTQQFKVTGSDFSTEFLNHLKSQNPDGSFLLLDAVTLETYQRFDAIYSNKVLHHLKDEDLKKSIKRQSEILKPGGIICHSFWKGEGTEDFKGMFVNYHKESDLRDFFGGYFEIMLLEPYQEFEDGDSLLLIAGKK